MTPLILSALSCCAGLGKDVVLVREPRMVKALEGGQHPWVQAACVCVVIELQVGVLPRVRGLQGLHGRWAACAGTGSQLHLPSGLGPPGCNLSPSAHPPSQAPRWWLWRRAWSTPWRSQTAGRCSAGATRSTGGWGTAGRAPRRACLAPASSSSRASSAPLRPCG